MTKIEGPDTPRSVAPDRVLEKLVKMGFAHPRTKRKLLPTSAPKRIPPEFMEKFKKHGWRRVEQIWGKSTVLAWRKAIGAKRMAAERKRFLKEESAR